MVSDDPKAMLTAMLQPWHEAVENPESVQGSVLSRLIADYAKTRYGQDHGAGNIDSIEDYRRAFPVATYEDYKPLIQEVMEGDVDSLLAHRLGDHTRDNGRRIQVHPHDTHRHAAAD
jgi:hypothetical protein